MNWRNFEIDELRRIKSWRNGNTTKNIWWVLDGEYKKIHLKIIIENFKPVLH